MSINMAEEAPEHQDRGMFGLFGKKKEEEGKKGDHIGQTPHGQTEAGSYYPAAPQHGVQHGQGHSHEEQFNPVETEQQKQKGLKGKPHRTDSSSSSSSSDDEKEGGKKKEGGRKKKGSKEKSKERLPVGGQQYSDEYGRGKDEKKTGMVDKFKEKIPGHQEKLPGEGKQYSSDQRRGEEEKEGGLLDKIKDKLPGHHNKNGGEEEEEEKEKKHFR